MPYAKAIVAVIVAALTALAPLLPVGSAATQWVDLALTVLGAAAVYAVPNRPAADAVEAGDSSTR